MPLKYPPPLQTVAVGFELGCSSIGSQSEKIRQLQNYSKFVDTIVQSN